MTYYYRFRSQFIWGKTNIKNNKEEERKKDYKILVLRMIFLQETSVLYVCRSIATQNLSLTVGHNQMKDTLLVANACF